MKIRSLLVPAAILVSVTGSMAQTAVHDATIIGPATNPHSSAVLDVKSTDKGVLVPNVDIANLATAAPVTGPAEGLLVYNTNITTGVGYYYWNGTLWTRVTSSGDQGAFWRLGGNSGTVVGTDYLGTSNNVGLAFSTNGTERMRLQSSGQLSIGATAAGAKLDVHQTTSAAVARLVNYSNVPLLEIRRTGGTQASPTATSSTNTVLARIDGQGYNGAGFTSAARIEMATDATGGTSTDMPGRITFSTTPDASGTLLERMRISNNGTVRMNSYTTNGIVRTTGTNGTLSSTGGGISLTTEVTGILPVANGGTGVSTIPANGVMLGNGTSAITTVAPGANGNVLISNGTSWTSGNANGSFIRNQTTLQNTSNFHISGVGRAVTSFQSPLYTRADAGTVAIRPFSNSITAIQLQNAAGTNILNVDATNSRVGIGTAAPSSSLHVNGGQIRLAQTAGQTPFQLLSYSNSNSLWFTSGNATQSTIVLSPNYALDWDRGVAISYTPGTTGGIAGVLDIGQVAKNNVNFTHGITRFFTNGTEKMRIASNGDISLTSKIAIRSNDAWLRLNPTNAFTNGIYVANFVRVDGGIASGGVGTSGAGTIRATSFITSNVGFRISNAAASGTYLRGNGTNYVSSAILAADLPAGSNNYIRNQTAAAQATSNYWISGYGRANNFRSANGTVGAPAYSFASQTNTGVYLAAASDWRVAIAGTWHFRVAAGYVQANGTFRSSNGTAAAPAHTFSSDLDNGMYLPTTNTLAFATTGAERMRIAANGNVGIGTTAPVQRLHLVGQMAINDNNTRILEGNGNAVRVQTNSGFIDIGAQNTSWSHFVTDRARFYFNKGITVDEGLIGSYDENLSLQTSGTTRMTILNSNGNVGIGTTTPATRLQVNGTHGDTQARLTLPAGSNGGGTGEVNLQLWVSEPGITWDAGGIGTNVTNNNGAPAGFGRINASLGQSYIRFITNGGGMAFNTTNNAGTYFQTMYMANGNVGIGTTAPSVSLDINGAGLAGNGFYRLRFGWYNGSEPTVSPSVNAWGYCGDPNLAFWRNYSYGYVNYSSRSKKRDVHTLSDSHLAALMRDIDSMELAFYKYNEDEDDLNPDSPSHYAPLHRLGTFTDAAPDYVLDNSLTGVNVYDFAALAMAGVKHLNHRVKALESTSAMIQETGSVQLASGDVRRIDFELSGSAGQIPVISVTVIGESGDARVISKDRNGFTIRTTGEVTVDWVAHHRMDNGVHVDVHSSLLPVKTRLTSDEKAVIRDAFSRMVNTPESR